MNLDFFEDLKKKVNKLVNRLVVPNSLRFQLLSRTLVIMAILLAVIGFVQYFYMLKFIYANNALSIQKQISAVPPEIWEQIASGGYYSDGRNYRLTFNLLPDSTIAVIDSLGNLTIVTNSSNVKSVPQLSAQDYINALQDKNSLNYRIVESAEGQEQMVVLQSVENRGRWLGVVQVSVGTNYMKDMLIKQLLTFILLAVIALIMGLFAFIPVLRRILVPLSNMVNQVEKIDAGNLSERLPVDEGQIEVNRLAVSFNGMLERLETSFKAEKEAKEQMRRFVADASHELRTPLTSIHGFTEVLLRGAMNQPERLYRSLKSMYTESERMKKLIEDLLLLAKLDRLPKLECTERDLIELVLEMENQLRLLAGHRKVSFNLNSPSKCWFNADKIKQVILNLFNNAVQHTDPESGEIEISVGPAEDGIELKVKDSGHGISEEHLNHLFERFYRVESSRTRKYGGSGLGLAITQSLVELHGGKIRVESTVGEGSTFCVWLPKEPLNIEG